MNYYQARISFETAQYLEEMRLYYELVTGGSVSKGECLNRAYRDSLSIVDWKKVYESKILISNHSISDSSNLLKVQITEETRDGIQKLKSTLPLVLGARSVTVGVCIREILKAAYFVTHEKNEVQPLDKVSEKIKESIDRLRNCGDNDIRKVAIDLFIELEKMVDNSINQG